MKRLLSVSCLLLVFSSVQVFAQAGAICIFSDNAGTTCSFTDNTAELMHFYVVQTDAAGATAVEFAAPIPGCMNGASWLADGNAFPVVLGNSQTGAAVAYGACLSGPIHIMTISAFTSLIPKLERKYFR